MRHLNPAFCAGLLAALSAIGHAEVERDIFDLSLEELVKINVTVATGQQQASRVAPAITSVITAAQLAAWGYDNVADALRHVPGLYCLDDGLADNCGVRGFNGGFRAYSNVIKVLINGQPMAFSSDSNNYLGDEFIPIELIDKIEVVRGPGSALYGADAFLGVINIVTRRPSSAGRQELATRVSADGQSVSMVLQTADDHSGWLLALARADHDRSGAKVPDGLPRYSLFSPGTKTIADHRQTLTAFAQYVHDLAAHQVEASLHFSRLDSTANFVDFGRFAETGQLNDAARIALDQSFIGLKDRWTMASDLQARWSVAYAEGQPSSRERLDLGLTDTIQRRRFGYAQWRGAGEFDWALTEHQALLFGVDHRSDREQLFEAFDIDRTTGVSTRRGRAQGKQTLTNTGLYLQYRHALNAQLETTLNARRDAHSIYGDQDNYRAALMYAWRPELNLKLLYGSSYKAPTAMQLYAQPLFDGEVEGNADLRPESAATWEAQLAWLIDDEVNFSVNAYQLVVDDQVQLMPAGSNRVPHNRGQQIGRGIEAELQWHQPNHRLDANVALQTSTVENVNLLGQIISEASELYPEQTANLFYRWRYSDRQQFGLHWFYASPRRASTSNIVLNGYQPYQRDRYHIVNAIWQIRIGAADVAVEMNNIFAQDYSEPGFSGVDLPGDRRSWQLRLAVEF